MNKQKKYVPPGVEIYRVKVEWSIAAGTAAIGPVSANIPDSWNIDTYGDDLAGEGGDVLIFGH
jgi:hypothetical protein